MKTCKVCNSTESKKWYHKEWRLKNKEKLEELLKACNYKNLQPLWAEDNFKKSNST